MINKFRIILFVLMSFLLSNAYADDKQFALRVDRNNITEGESVGFYMDFSDVSDITRPDIDLPAGLEIRYRGPSSQISIINGRTKRSISHSYALIAHKAGKYTLGPLLYEYKKDKFKSNSIDLNVRSRQEAAKENKNQIGQYVFVRFESSKKDVFKKEYFDISVSLFYQSISLHNLEFPKIKGGELVLEDFGQPVQDTVIVDGVRFNRVKFETRAYASSAGLIDLGAASLQVDMAVTKQRRNRFGGINSMFDDFFNSTQLETLYLSSDDLLINVKDLPELNRPLDYSGIVGDFSMTAQLDNYKPNAGDPITLSVKVQGEGPLELIKGLKLDLDEKKFKIYDPQIINDFQSKQFDYVIIPKKPEKLTIPKFGFWIFDTRLEDYRFLSQGPYDIDVQQGTNFIPTAIVSASQEAQGDSKFTEPEYAEDIIFIKEKVKRWVGEKKKDYNMVNFIPLLLFILCFLPYLHLKKLASDEGYVAKLRSPKVAREGLRQMENAIHANDAARFYESMFHTMQKFIAFKLHCNKASVDQTKITALIDLGYTQQQCEIVKNLFDVCDMARFASSAITEDQMLNHYKHVKEFLCL